MAALAQCEQAANNALAQACGPEMRVRDNLALLQASDRLRRTLETAVKFVEAIELQPCVDGSRSDFAAAVTQVANDLRKGFYPKIFAFENKRCGGRA